MKMAIVTPFLESYGGMERVILRMAQHFNADIYCLRYTPQTTFEEFRGIGIRTPKPSFFSRTPPIRLTSAIEAGLYFYNLKLDGYDIINSHQVPSEWIRNKNKPVIWYCHSPNREAFDLYNWRMKRRNIFLRPFFWGAIEAFKHVEFKTIPNIEHIFTNSKNTQWRIKHYLKKDSEVLYPGIDNFKFKSYGQFFFLPSRLVPEKDIEFAIEAHKKSKTEYPLIIAGSTKDDKYYRKLRKMVGKRGLVLPNISDDMMKILYSYCYAVLYTPVNEDFGLVPLEAMASKKTCIAKAEGGVKETVIYGHDGLWVNSTDEMSKSIRYLVDNPERCKEMGRNGYKKVKKDFTWNKFMKRFEEKAQEVIEWNKKNQLS